MDDGTVLGGFDLRQMLVPVSTASDLEDVRSLLLHAGYAGIVLDHPEDGADHVLVLVLVDDWGEPLRWRTDVGAARFVRDSTASLRAVVAHRFGDGVEIQGDEFPDDDDVDATDDGARLARPVLGITSMAWFTFKNLDNYGGLVAGAIESPVVVAPLDRSHVYAPLEGRERLLDSQLPETYPSILLWRTASRRGVFIRKRRTRALHWWDEAFALVDPSDSRPLSGNGLRVADVIDGLRGDQGGVIADIAAAFRLDTEAAERLRILCRRRPSDDTTFSELVAILALPTELADIADGRLDPESLPGAAVKHPQTLRQNLAEDWAEIRSVFREPAPERSRSPFDAWQRMTARRPLWYTILTVVIVGASVALAVSRLLAGGGPGSIVIQIVVAVLWTWSYLAPRGRFLEEDRTDRETTNRRERDDVR